MRRWVVAVTLLTLAARPVAAQTSYRVSWRDGAAVAAAAALALIPSAAGLPHGPPPCAPCDPASIPAIDRAALHTFSAPAGTASSVLLVGVAGFAGLASLDGASAAEARGHAAVFANSLAWTLAATEWVKAVTHRSRPVLYTSAAPAAASDHDNRRSFPSGHAALAFAAATSYLAIARREQLPHRTRNAILLFSGAVGVSVLRVAAGKHFPTDVAAGAALGAGVGWLVPTIHATNR